MDDVDSLLSFPELIRARKRLRQGDPSSFEERTRFAASITSTDDVSLMKRLLFLDVDSEIAAHTALVLLTRGGIGNLNASIREWLELGNDNAVAEAAANILDGYVRELHDGTALRQLIEFSGSHDFSVVLRAIVMDSDRGLPLERMLQRSRSEQVATLVDPAGGVPSNRSLWVLRTYGREPSVKSFLLEHALDGIVAALASYAVTDSVTDWKLVAAAEPKDAFDSRLLVNVVLDALSRQTLDSCGSEAFEQRLDESAKREFRSGLACLVIGN